MFKGRTTYSVGYAGNGSSKRSGKRSKRGARWPRWNGAAGAAHLNGMILTAALGIDPRPMRVEGGMPRPVGRGDEAPTLTRGDARRLYASWEVDGVCRWHISGEPTAA